MKKTFNRPICWALATALLCLTACKHNENSIVKPTTAADTTSILSILERYYKVANTRSDGTFMFESNLSNNDPKITDIVLAGGIFYDTSGNAQTGGGQLSIGNHTFTPNQRGQYGFDKSLPQSGLYGTNVTFSLTPPKKYGSASSSAGSARTNGIDPTITADPTVTATLYSPAAISITNVAPMTPVVLVPNGNTTLTWNADANNANGVVIIAEYIPSRYINKSSLAANYTALIENSMQVADNGSTSIPWSFFSNFPPDGHIILWVSPW